MPFVTLKCPPSAYMFSMNGSYDPLCPYCGYLASTKPALVGHFSDIHPHVHVYNLALEDGG